MDQIKREKGVLLADPLKSYGLSISGKHTASGKPVGAHTAQTDLDKVPGVLWQARLVNKELEIDMEGYNFPPFPLMTEGTYQNGKYIFCVNNAVGSFPGQPAVLQNPEDDIFLRTETIEIRGAPSIEIDVFGSPYLGYVTRQGFTSPLFEGEKSLVRRTLSFGKELEWFSPANLFIYASSFEELRDTVRGPGWNEQVGDFSVGHDNQCNIFGFERGGWYDFEAAGANELIPQGILGNPIPPTEEMVLQSGYAIKNPKKGYVISWNTPMAQNTLSVYGDAEVNRASWIERIIESAISEGKITTERAIGFFSEIGNASNGAADLSLYTGQNYNVEAFTILFRQRFTEAVSVYPTPDRLAAVALLSDFDGKTIEGDKFDLINSLDVSDKWILAQQWQWYVHQAMLEPTFGTAWPSWVTSNKNNTVGLEYGRWIQSLLARLLGTSPVNNPINYPDWLTPISDLDLLIAQALDDALAFLGGLGSRPWGQGQRATVSYVDSTGLFGPLDFPNQNAPNANRGSAYYFTEMVSNHDVNQHFVNQIGNSALILFEDDVPTLQDTAMSQSWTNFTPEVVSSFKGKKQCHKKKK